VQSLAQLRARYGEENQQAILAATSAKLIFGGLSNGDDLRDISAWAGERRISTVSQNYQGGVQQYGVESPMHRPPDSRASQGSVGSMFYPALPVKDIQQLPPFQAWLFYRSDAPVRVEARPAGLVPAFKESIA
jgi:hypothetical protein